MQTAQDVLQSTLHHVDGGRLWRSLMELAQLGATAKGGVCRLALTDLDRQARDLFVTWAQAAGCTVTVDAVGNIFARRPGRNPTLPPVMTGSHIDTQPTGGKFDGCFGVMAGLEVLRTLNDLKVETEAPLEVVVWTNEEGSRFAPCMMGSGVFAEKFTLEETLAKTDAEGITVGEALNAIGYAGSRAVTGHPVGAYFEAHIEQGPILEDQQKTIGVVLGALGRHDPAWATYLAEQLGLRPLLERYPEQLSGGQQQRLAIGRALAAKPSLMLADEPTGSLDEASSDTVLELLLRLVGEAGSSLLMVTHSPRLAARLSRQCYLHLGRVQPQAV